jgi:AraC-like DNA-binding protein
MEDIRYSDRPDFIIDSIDFISVVRNAGFVFNAPEDNEKYSMIFVERGELEYYFYPSGQTLRVSGGMIIYIPRFLSYKATYLVDNTLIKKVNFTIKGEEISSFLLQPFCKKSLELAEVFGSVTPLNRNNTFFLLSKTYELISVLQNVAVKVPQKYKKLMPAVTEIKEKYFENQKLSYYAALCNMSESNFRLLFKEFTGKSFIDYRNAIRVLEAKKMIEGGYVADITDQYRKNGYFERSIGKTDIIQNVHKLAS